MLFDNLVKGKQPKALAVLKLQAMLILMLLAGFLHVFFKIGFEAFFLLQGLLVLVYLYLIFTDLKKAMKEDFLPAVIFFIILLAIIQASLSLAFFRQSLALQAQLVMGLVLALLVFAFGFRLFLGKGYTTGTVLLCSNKMALVETDFDLRSFVVAGKYPVTTNKKYAEGSKVKIRIRKSIIASRPESIMGKL